MTAEIEINGNHYRFDPDKPLDISVPLDPASRLNAFHGPVPEITPVRMGSFTGSVAEGGAVNFNNIFFNPHSHGTHTECVGHISKEMLSVHHCLQRHFFTALLISVEPQRVNNDLVILKNQVGVFGNEAPEALVVRTVPNSVTKMKTDYSGKNAPYFEPAALQFLREAGVQHLLTDLPSVDREEDGGKLAAHRAFWNYPAAPRMHCTITELIYVPDNIKDGDYVLNLQIAPFLNDAAPSRPVLYEA